jgi:hypothetical protein
MPASCHTRCAKSLLMPSALDSFQQLQLIDPSPGVFRVTFDTLARKLFIVFQSSSELGNTVRKAQQFCDILRGTERHGNGV